MGRVLTVGSLVPETLFRMIPYSFGSSIISVMAGFTVTRTGAYRGVLWAAWAIMIVGWSLMTTLDDHSST